jgi:hypothetical protein
MRTSKLLELAALLKQYAETASGTRRIMADSLGKTVEDEAKAQEVESENLE